MKDISSKYGPESMALFTHGNGSSYFTNLMKAFGSANIAEPSYAQCKGPRDEAFLATFGEEVYSPEVTDIRDTKCLVLIDLILARICITDRYRKCRTLLIRV